MSTAPAGDPQVLRGVANVSWTPVSTELGAFVAKLQGTAGLDGKRIVVVCKHDALEMPAGASLDAAQEKAIELATAYKAPAFILKPIRKVDPPRDAVTTELE